VRELEEMSRAYIRPKNVIILAVSPANADIATSDAMRLVREFDPQGARCS
jgi:dynamin 1-like protein